MKGDDWYLGLENSYHTDGVVEWMAPYDPHQEGMKDPYYALLYQAWRERNGMHEDMVNRLFSEANESQPSFDAQ